MANLYSVPLKNAVQKTLSVTLTQAETASITFDSSVDLELQASSSMPGILVIDRIDVNGNLTPTKAEYIEFTGVSGTTVTGLTRGIGGTSAQGHSIGAIVEFVPDVVWAEALNDVFTTQHNADGTHKTLSLISLASVTINNSFINDMVISGGSLASTTILTSNIDTFSFKNLNAPEGFLINGKIVPSVASNNLTVAIKTLAGNDPSASDPVYVRIGDVIRTITTTTQTAVVTAGTNWFNSGSAELAGKEIDYFVYAQWDNSENKVNVGFARIPYATISTDFVANNVSEGINERYFRTTTEGIILETSDIFVNIGRFAATLSAGASYNWSVPTFNAGNLIQRPVYESRRLLFDTVRTATAPMTITSNEAAFGFYVISGRNCFVVIYSYGDFGGTATSTFGTTLPFTNNSGFGQWNSVPGNEFSYATTVGATLYIADNTSTAVCEKVGAAAWSLQPTTGIRGSFTYTII
jgi:hypothetical protein